MNGDTRTGPKVAVGCGGILLFLAFCVSAFGAFHVFVDPHGAISADEAMPALIGGVLCMGVDFLIVAVGAALWMRGGASGAPPMGGVPGAPPMGGMPGAPPMGGAPAGPPSPPPWHLLSGCGSLFFLLTMCVSLGFAVSEYDDVQRWESNRSSDIAMGEDPIMIMLDEGAIRRHTDNAMAGGCCCGLSGALLLAFAGGTVALIQRRRAAQGR